LMMLHSHIPHEIFLIVGKYDHYQYTHT
jgi:hypothetical protein